MNGTMKKSFHALADILIPRTCTVCGCRLNLAERHLCIGCLADMPMTYFWMQTHNAMADRFNNLIRKHLDEAETPGREMYSHAAALFFYHNDAGYRHIPYQIKYHGNTVAGRYFGSMLGKRLAENRMWDDVDIVIPVPLHRTRQWKRGYNQAEIIASAIASELKVPMRTDILVRRRRTATQTKLDIEGKVRNVAGAFSTSEDAAIIFRNGGNVQHILLADDVFTTGSTLFACFTALRKVFPPSVRISVATLGFVGGT